MSSISGRFNVKVKSYFRKGENNKKFREIVGKVTTALELLEGNERLKSRLLVSLHVSKQNLGGAWQDADTLLNLLGKNSGHRFDLYNWENKTAIEIEESEVKYLWKDLVKLSIGARKKRVENAILICPFAYRGKTMKTPVGIYAQAIKISEFMSDFLWMKNLAIIGYER